MSNGGDQIAQVAQLLKGGVSGQRDINQGTAGAGAQQGGQRAHRAIDKRAGADNSQDEPDEGAAGGAGPPGEGGAQGVSGDAGQHQDRADESGHESGGDHSAPGSGSDSEADDAPYTLKELAAKLEVPAKALYDLVIPLGDGESATLGEIKDMAKAGQAAQAELADLQDGLTDRENELLRGRIELAEIAQAMGPNLPPAARQALAQRRAAHMEQQQAAMLRAIPQWANEKVYAADSAVMLDFVKQYGFNARDMESIGDHKLVKLIYDVSKSWAKARALKLGQTPTDARQITAPGAKRTQSLAGSLRATIDRASKPGATKADRLAGIDALLKS